MAVRHRDVEENYGLVCMWLLLGHDEGDLDEEELLLLLLGIQINVYEAMLPPLQFAGHRMCLENLDDETCLRRFRLSQAHCLEMLEALDMPANFSQKLNFKK